ncbi:hypothetical protein [Acinetobacter equi]|uniref:Uncharacterized protein n=1 Tax=Acinetobacter equi TaxID=1324350 RepID=A0A0N9VA09_9GAMM|nr:hypothetical protein [Acinetobacter equi]ALH94078.1 hypothetical protein AOY20_00165 [Acinetobacter equi]
MKNIYIVLGATILTLGLTACQSTARQYNGTVGYKIEQQTANTATISYTLAARKNQAANEAKLQHACGKVLGDKKQYTIKILSINEIINPNKDVEFGRQIGNSRTTVGLSNTPSLYNSEDYATKQALDSHPSTLHVVRYTCS